MTDSAWGVGGKSETPIDDIYREIGEVVPGSSLEAALYHADEAYRSLEKRLRDAEAVLAKARDAAAWISAEIKPTKDDIYIVRDIDGQMAFASFTASYEWEHVADVDCGTVTAWHPLPTERTK